MDIEAPIRTPKSVEDLEAATRRFFALHWSISDLGNPPGWDRWESFLYGSVPNYAQGGCYALFEPSGLVYVGLGASRGGGRYAQHGISRRLMSHVLRIDRAQSDYHSALLPKWAAVTSLFTLGLGRAPYLAASLETFLIRELDPPMNGRV